MKMYALALLLFAGVVVAIEPASVPSTFVVPAAATLQGVAGTAAAITYTVSGVEQQGAIQTPKTLAQGQLPTSVGILYTGPAGVYGYVGSISLINTTGLAVSNVKLFIGGSGAANQVLNSITIPANGQAVYNGTGWRVSDASGAQYVVGTQYTAGSGLSLSDNAFSISPTTDISWNSHKITSLLDPTLTQDAATKNYVDSRIQGLEHKNSCDEATTAALPASTYNNGSSGAGATLTENTNGALIVDGSTPLVNERMLIKDQVVTADNGIYVVTQVGSPSAPFILTRSADFDGSGDTIDAGDTTYVVEGGTLTGTTWTVTSPDVATVGTDPIVFGQTAGPGSLVGGTGIVITSNTIDAQTDNATLEIVSDQIREKNGGTTNAKLADMAQATFKMRAAAAGTGVPIDGTAAQAKTALAITSSDVSGLAAIATSGSANDMIGGTVASARGGAGTVSGLLKANGAGVVSAAVSSTDYAPATSGSALLLGSGSGGFSNYAGATPCTNQFFTGFSTTGVSTCMTDTLASAQHANQGTTTTVLHGNAAGNPAFGAVVDADISGQVGNTHGGTGQNSSAATGVAQVSSGTWSFGTILSSLISDFAATVRSTVLTGLSTTTGAIITASDTVLGALGKLQWQITANKGMYNAVYDFNMVGDQRVVFDGACSTGANTHITSATVAFVSGDVGKRITLNGAGSSAAVLVGVVSVINSGTDATITGATCAVTVSGKGLQLGTDNTTACNLIVSTMNALTYPGAKIIFPPSSTNRWACPVDLPFTVGVDLIGQASAVTQDFADYAKGGGTALVWWGTDNDGGTAFQGFVQFAAIAANDRPLSGAGLHDIWIDCRNGDQNPCLTAVRLVDAVAFDIRNMFVMDALSGFNTATANMVNVTANTGRGIFSNIGARLLDNTNTPQAGALAAVTLTPTFVTAGSNAQVMTAAINQSIAINTANGFATPGYFWFTAANGSVYLAKCTGGGGTTTLTNCGVSTDGAAENPTLVGAASAATASSIVQASPNNAAAMFMEGTTSTNSNLFTLAQARWSFGTNYGPAALEFHNSDSISIHQSVGNGGNATNDGAVNRVRRPGVRFGGSAASSAQASRNNSLYDGDAGAGGVVAMGVNNAGAILAGASGPNYWYRYQTGNGAAIPVIEAVTATTTQAPVGAIFEWTGNGPLTQTQGPNRPSVLTPSNSLASTVATDVIIPGCLVKLPPQWAQAGLQIQFRINLTKTAAGTPTHIYKIFYGASGAVGTDTAMFTSATGAAGTAAIDAEEITENILLPSTGAAVSVTGSIIRTGKMNAAATGYGNMTVTAPTIAAINTGTLQTFMYPAIRTSAAGETNTVVSCKAEIIQAAAQ